MGTPPVRLKLPEPGTLFVNPRSGARDVVDDLIDAARKAGLEVVEVSPEIDCAREIRERARRGITLFIAAGGDGTVHHVMQAVVQSEAALAVIPIGTYNHFARDLGIPLDWRQALDVALSGDRKQIDTARVNDRYFVNNLSLGLYPDLVARREARGRDYPRWKARLFAFYATARQYHHVSLTLESDGRHEVIRTHVFMISNNGYDLGRIGIEAPRGSLEDGRLNVYWLPHTSRWRLARYVARYLAGRVREIPEFRSFRTTRLRVQSRAPLRVGLDGELFKMQSPLVITIVPQSLNVKVPR
jgi:YegS/Rv2252/BmrU family lipid kinase